MTKRAAVTFPHLCAWQAGVLGCVLLAGCSPGKGSVSGIVRYQGKPLATGTILFFDERQRVRQSDIREDGSYEVTDVVAGTVRIAVMAPMDIPFQTPGAPKSLTLPGGTSAPRGKSVTLPARYADPAESGLTFPVVRGSNHRDVDLTP
jgi:hypothetical protein